MIPYQYQFDDEIILNQFFFILKEGLLDQLNTIELVGSSIRTNKPYNIV